MQRPRKYLRFSLRALLLCLFVIAIPAWWIGRKHAEYAAEQVAIASMQETYEDLSARSTYFGPRWIPAEYRPIWLNRVYAVDVTGFVYGNRQNYRFDRPFPFDDSDLESILPALESLRHLQELQVPYTNVSDAAAKQLHALPKLTFVNAQQSLVRSSVVLEREAGESLEITLGPKLPVSMRLLRNQHIVPANHP